MKHKAYLFYWIGTVGLIVLMQMLLAQAGTINISPQAAYSKDGELSEVKFSFFSPQGHRLYYVESNTLSYSNGQEDMYLAPLRIIYTSPEGVLTTLESDSGKSFSAGAIVLLEGNVHINQPSSLEAPVHKAETDSLIIDAKNKMATTDQPAIIQQGSHVFSGTGMEIDLSNGKMRLLKDVKVQGS